MTVNHKIASYTPLMTLAELAGDHGALSALQTSLNEEQEMAQWLDAHLKDVTTTFAQRSTAGQKADR